MSTAVHRLSVDGEVRQAACGAPAEQDMLSEIVTAVTCAHCKLIDEVTQRDRKIAALLKENEQLRNIIAGNTRELPPGATAGEQHAALFEALTKARHHAADGRLTSLAIFWDEGREIVLHVAQKPKPLIEIAAIVPH